MLKHLNMDDSQNPAKEPLTQAETKDSTGEEIKISYPPEGTHSRSSPNRLCFFEERPALSQSSPKIYPNNTLVEDLSKCHENLKPKLVRVACRFREAARACWPGSKSADIRKGSRNDSSKSMGQVPATLRAGQSIKPRHQFMMPSSIVRLNSTMSADDYNCALSVLSSDMRFKLHLLLYNRIQSVWTMISTGVCVLVALLTFTTLTSVIMTAVWFAAQATGFFVCRKARKQLNRMLERSVSQVNTFFMDHNLMLGVINEGGLLTKSRFVIPVIFFDAFQCIEQIDSMVKRDLASMQTLSDQDENQQRNESQPEPFQVNQRILARAVSINSSDFSSVSRQYSRILINPSEPTGNKQQLAKKIVLDFSQRWITHFDRSRLLHSDEGSKPRHLSTGKCLCQFIEENLVDDEEEPAEATVHKVSHSIVEGAAKISIGNILERDQGEEFDGPNSRPNLTSPLDKTYELSAIDLFQDVNQLSLIKTSAESGRLSDVTGSFSHLHGRAVIESSNGSEWSLPRDQDESLRDRSESLFRNLKMLFELRNSELSKNNDAGSILDYGKSSPNESRHTPNSIAIGRENKEDERSSPGKRFFARFDGVSSLIPRRNKPVGLYASPHRQMLDIC